MDDMRRVLEVLRDRLGTVFLVTGPLPAHERLTAAASSRATSVRICMNVVAVARLGASILGAPGSGWVR
jgi:hypothetical protein